MPGEGRLFVLEGIDKVVLRVQVERLCHWLRDQGIAAEQTCEPTQGPVGAQIRLVRQGRLHIVPESVALLEVADRLDHLTCQESITAWLADQRTVVCVHYTLSTYAHHWHELDWKWLRQINARCRPPDLTLYIDTPLSPVIQAETPQAEQLQHNYRAAIAALQGEGEAIAVIDGRVTEDEILHACQAWLAPQVVSPSDGRPTPA